MAVGHGDAEESEQGPELVERVAAIDIAKASGMVCTRVPHEEIPGRRVQRVWHVAATSGAVLDLADHLVRQGVTPGGDGGGLDVLEAVLLPAGSPWSGLLAGQRP
ncbi:hypothetical protein ACWF95_40200 [Streptomyces vinaceus]